MARSSKRPVSAPAPAPVEFSSIQPVAIERERRYWLVKSEPEVFSIQHLNECPERTAGWDGVRNYQARNFLRDDFKLGDQVFFYHSNAEPPGIAGIAEVVREGYPDHTAFDPTDHHFDPKSKPENPTWFMVDLKLVRIFPEVIALEKLKQTPGLENMLVTRRGMRLSVQPVTKEEWQVIESLVPVAPETAG
ncbi:MAG TPA: EVE domain-containing protein [Acidobacteriota bacterium]|nr:EVE domain-containing protein [Acidobacteriota bacterium]